MVSSGSELVSNQTADELGFCVQVRQFGIGKIKRPLFEEKIDGPARFELLKITEAYPRFA